MSIARANGTPHVGMSPSVCAVYPDSSSQSAAVNFARLQLRTILAQVESLERALASSQQESLAAHHQVEILTNENARLRVHAGQREHEVPRPPSRCLTWKPTDFCASLELDPEATPEIRRLLTRRTHFRKNGVLYRAGDKFSVLYAIRAGSCKTALLANDGQGQVAGFHMAGEIIGVDGVGTDIHECEAIALEDMEVCRLPFDQIEHLAQLSEKFAHALHKLLSQESARIHTLMIVLGAMRAEQRLAMFLVNLSQRYRARGYSSCEFVLRMTRAEIGSYLGLKLETVSRLFSRFQQEGLLQVKGRDVRLLDRAALSRLVDRGA